jgi:hypothetical protein
LEQRDVDDADEDGNTVYRGLAVPVDIKQVVEVRDLDCMKTLFLIEIEIDRACIQWTNLFQFHTKLPNLKT